MNFEEPKESFDWPPKARISYIHLGSKCFVRLIPSKDGNWWEMGGQQTKQNGSVAGDSLEADTSGGDGDEDPEDYVHLALLNEDFVVDKRQARIYYRFNTSTQNHDCRIILPKDFHFRSNRKGVKKSEGKRAKSFMEDGMPCPEVLLLYALRTQKLVDRRIAVEAFPQRIWNAQNLEELFAAMDHNSINHQNFCSFAGRRLSLAATRPGELADWAEWEKVAEAAIARSMGASQVEDQENQDIQARFLRSLEEAVKANRGLPAQLHVRNQIDWKTTDAEQITNRWKELLNTMGMTWLPGEQEWNKFRRQVKLDELDHVTHIQEQTNRSKAKSSKSRR